MEESKIKSELKFLKTISKTSPKALEHYFKCEAELPADFNLPRAKKMLSNVFKTELDLLLSNPEHYFKNKKK